VEVVVMEGKRGEGSGRAMASGSSSPSSPTGNDNRKDTWQDLLGLQREGTRWISPWSVCMEEKERKGREVWRARVCRPKFK
jgi:hypothetical protein